MKTNKKITSKKQQKSGIARFFGSRRGKIGLVIVAFAIVGVVILQTSSAATTSSENTSFQRLQVLGVAGRESGVLDSSARVHEYTGRSDDPEWCAYFVSWVLKTSGYALREGNWRVPAVFRGSDNLKDLFISMGAYQAYDANSKQPLQPRFGDVVLFSRSHTGFFSKINSNGEVYTIEGNSAAAGKPNRVTSVTYKSMKDAGIMGWGNIDGLIRSPTK